MAIAVANWLTRCSWPLVKVADAVLQIVLRLFELGDVADDVHAAGEPVLGVHARLECESQPASVLLNGHGLAVQGTPCPHLMAVRPPRRGHMEDLEAGSPDDLFVVATQETHGGAVAAQHLAVLIEQSHRIFHGVECLAPFGRG